MAGLSKSYVTFFKELAANNDREWFNANKKRFEQDVKKPFEALTGEVIALMQKVDPGVQVSPAECVFRIFRDTRFSKDKSPYKLHMAAVVGRGGRKDHSYPGIYYQAGAEGIAIAGGCWEPEKDLLTKIRSHIAKDPKRVRRILDKKKFKDTFGGLGGDKNKIIPPEFRPAGELVPEIYNKSYHYWAEYKGQKHITQEGLARTIVDHYKIASEWNGFLLEVLQEG